VADSLDFQRHVDVPEGKGLRVRAVARTHGALQERLRIEAREQ